MTPGVGPRLSVALGLWADRPPDEALVTAAAAERLGYGELWIGEMATYDAFSLATAIGLRTARLRLTVGPLAVAVRDPVMVAMGIASVSALIGRPVGVALGTSSPAVVEGWHGRSRARPFVTLEESAVAIRRLLDGDRPSTGPGALYRLRLPPPGSSGLTIAAFGPRAVRVAARHAGRMAVNLVGPTPVARLTAALHRAAAEEGRSPPAVAAWVAAAVGRTPAAFAQLRQAVVAYLAAPGYAEILTEAGFRDVVALARTQPHPRRLVDAIPDSLLETVAFVGDETAIAERLKAYRAAGVDELAVVPVCTDDDPGGERTLRTLAALAVPPPGPEQTWPHQRDPTPAHRSAAGPRR